MTRLAVPVVLSARHALVHGGVMAGRRTNGAKDARRHPPKGDVARGFDERTSIEDPGP